MFSEDVGVVGPLCVEGFLCLSFLIGINACHVLHPPSPQPSCLPETGEQRTQAPLLIRVGL